MTDLLKLGTAAKKASRILAVMDPEKKNCLLSAMADRLEADAPVILDANRRDLARAKQDGMSEIMQDRLLLTEERIRGIADGIRAVVDLPDPVGRLLETIDRPNGLKIDKISVPLGVVAIIYEARPNVTADAAALCFKSGNACILRTGREAIESGAAIAASLRAALKEGGAPADAVCFVEDPSRETATALMKLNGYVDVLIPRGGAGLIRSVVQQATVPVIETGTGNCHIYVDEDADYSMAAEIVFNAKTSRPSVCNAAESLLVHRSAAEEFLPILVRRLDAGEHYVTLVGDREACEILGQRIDPASQEDYGTEYLDYKMSVKIVDSVQEAIDHINTYSTGHSECIVTKNPAAARLFTAGVDSAAVYVNASTRFTDGGEFGFGAEIGISTQKLHARGPMGLRELCSYKYVIHGCGQIR